MKKNFLIIALILLFIPLLISAQTSGWRDKGNYKEQILLKDSLVSMCFSEDGTKFYTLHYNKIVYYWDFKTGLLIDSLILPKNLKVVKFSSDGNTIIGCDNIYPTDYNILFNSNLYIIDLDSKNLITKSNFKLPGSMDCGYAIHGFVSSSVSFNVMDYHFSDSILDLVPGLIFETYYSDVYTNIIYTALGGAAKFKVYKDTLIKTFQITTLPTYDFVQFDESYYISNFSMKEDYYGSSSLKRQNNKYTNSFNKLTNGKVTNLFNNEFIHSSYWERDHQGGGSSDSGSKIPYYKIFYDNNQKIVYLKAIDTYYYLSSINDNILDSITLNMPNYNSEIMSKDFQYFIYPNYNTIIFHNVITKKIDDTFICPFSPLILRLSPYGKSIIVADVYGNIALFENTILKSTTATLTTENVSNITLNSVVSGGNIFDEGNSSITVRGVCWSTTTNPTIVNTKTSEGSGIGIFTSNVTGLNPNTIYYLRAYATNSEGTSYGNQITFSTSISSVSEQVNNKNDYFDFITPNPASDFIYLPETNNLIKEATIYSIFGEKVMQLNNSQSNIVDISGLSKGVYFLRINNKSYKFVKI